MLALLGATRTIARGLSVAGLLLLLCFAAATLADGLLRSFFGRPIDLVRDIGGVLAAIAITLCFPYAFFRQANISIEAITGFLGEPVDRLLRFATAIVVQVVMLLVAIEFLRHAHKIATAGEISVALNIPLAPFWYVVASNFWLTFAAQTVLVVESAAAFFFRRGTLLGTDMFSAASSDSAGEGT